MNVFSVGPMRDKVWNRYLTELRSRPKKADRAAARWTQDTAAIEDLERIVRWCRRKGIEVRFSGTRSSMYSPLNRRINMSSRLRPTKQVAVLLHECGHSLVTDGSNNDRFGMGYSQADRRTWRTLEHRFTILDEEMEAWRRGWNLSRRLGLSITKDVFNAVRFDCLKSYLHWTLLPHPIPEDEEDR